MVRSFNIDELFKKTFGTNPYRIDPENDPAPHLPGYRINGSNKKVTQLSGSALYAHYENREVWLPIKFVGLDVKVFGQPELIIPHAVIRISGKKTIVKTPLAERQGTVKELYSVEDYAISIKGFLIDEKYRVWPERELNALKKLWSLSEAVKLDNALTNVFLASDQKVVIENFDLPEVEGGRNHVRPFSMQLESDSVFELELEN